LNSSRAISSRHIAAAGKDAGTQRAQEIRGPEEPSSSHPRGLRAAIASPLSAPLAWQSYEQNNWQEYWCEKTAPGTLPPPAHRIFI
jgi:hypothetical protein